jgi:hypothetical protein
MKRRGGGGNLGFRVAKPLPATFPDRSGQRPANVWDVDKIGLNAPLSAARTHPFSGSNPLGASSVRPSGAA